MNQKLLTKVLATATATVLTMANFVTLGVYASKVYATSTNLEAQETSIESGIEFDAYFDAEKGEKTHSVVKNISDKESKINLSVDVKKGYLKNAVIELKGTNFKITDNGNELTSVEKIDVGAGTISLKQINAGTGVKLDIPFESIKDDVIDLSNFSKINNIKLIGTYVNNEGKQKNIEKTIQVKLDWKEAVNLQVEENVKTYIPYTIGENEGTILQTEIKTGLENNALPIKETNISIKVPELNGVKPEKVIVTANTYATNNSGEEKFTSNNYTYDEQTGTLNIRVTNEANDGKVAWNKTEKDKYIITYIYKGKQEAIQTTEKTHVTIDAYSSAETKVEKDSTINIEEKEIKGNFISSNINVTDSLSKGYLYTKAERETEYKEEINTEISYQEVIDKITIEPKVDNFVNSDGSISPTTVGNANYAHYKETIVSKENFIKVLGEEGSLKIYGAAGEELATFNKETIADENGNFVYKYENETNIIKMETSKPVSNNTLKITNVKALKGNTDYSKNQVENFLSLNVTTNTQAVKGEIALANVEATSNIELVEPSTKIEAMVSNANLSTIVKNENVEFRVILKTDDITCDLYKNPTVEIVLPSYIQELAIKDINLLYDDELKIESYDTYKNDVGNTIIKVILKGEDTKYNLDKITKGANIVINTDITLKNLTPTTEGAMKVYVTNEFATTHESANQNMRKARAMVPTQNATSAYAETSLRAVAPVGMVTLTTISGYNGEEAVNSVNGEATGKLAVNAEAKTATVNINLINNYSNKVTETKVLGRIPFEGNKDILTNGDLGSNLTTTLKNFNANGATVYYSENAQATQDLDNTANGWNTNLTENAKSYLVVLGDMETGATKTLSYEITIPEKLTHNKQAYATHVVYFTNGATPDKQKADKVGFSTGEGADLEVKISSDIENGAAIQAGEILTYTIAVKNIGKGEANNIIVTGIIPEGSVYISNEVDNTKDESVKEYTETIDSLKPGEEKSISYIVEVSTLKYTKTEIDEEHVELKLEELILKATANAKVAGEDTTYDSNEIENNVVDGLISAKFSVEPFSEYVVLNEEAEFTYVLEFKNRSANTIDEIVIKDVIPDGLSVVSISEDGKYDENSKTVTWTIKNLQSDYDSFATVRVKTNKLEENVYKKEIENKMTMNIKQLESKATNKYNEKTIETKTITTSVAKPNLSATQTTNIKNGVISVGDTISYNVIIQNKAGRAREIQLKDTLPDELEYISASCTVNGVTNKTDISNDNTIIVPVTTDLSEAEFATISIKAKVKELPAGETQKEITNVAKISANGVDEFSTNEVKLTISSKGGTSSDPTTGEIQEGTYTISGTAWLDSNENGAIDADESTLGNIDVTLINAENGQIVKDIVTGNNKQQATNEDGRYTFANLEAGKYIVVYQYDTINYGLTTYKKTGISEEINSDAIANKIQINGETKNAAVTDAIEVGDSNISGVNLGLVVNKKFDLKLDKVVSKITATDSKGKTKVNDCKDSKFAKMDLSEKTINGANVVVEYKIRVTNEGQVAGYAKKIVDYLPKEMKFSSNLNKDWYQGEDGNIYNASLANTIIAPGETKELTLVLTKQMTSESTGNINNTAEIYESYNDFGTNDADSTPANKVQEEDDMSSADVVLGIKTGEVYIYIAITLITISIFGAGIYLINKKVLKKI